MKSPAELKQKLRRQWDNADLRESRLLGGGEAWPVEVSIGRPSPLAVKTDLDTVMRHVQGWRDISIGEVVWDSVSYRSTAEHVEVPRFWHLRRPTEWLKACGDSQMRAEFETLAALVEQTDSNFHSMFIRRRSLWRGKPLAEIAQASRLAMSLEPGCAAGRPLRTLSIAGTELPAGLTATEQKLYQRLLSEPHGRLEQEFLLTTIVHQALSKWAESQ